MTVAQDDSVRLRKVPRSWLGSSRMPAIGVRDPAYAGSREWFVFDTDQLWSNELAGVALPCWASPPPSRLAAEMPRQCFLKEKQDDQAHRSCWLCLSRRNIVAGNDPRAASSTRQLNHAGPVWLRPRYGHGEWPMHGQGSHPPGP